MIINHNLAAMNSQRVFNINQGSMNKSIEKLSSGLRINRAGDDAAGLAVSEKMRSQVRGLNMASRNAQDGISLLQTAEGWLNEATNIIQRIRELSVQAANGVYTEKDRAFIQKEVSQLVEEIDRINDQAEFNTLRLFKDGNLSGSATDGAVAGDQSAAEGLRIHVGANADQAVTIRINDIGSKSLGIEDIGATANGDSAPALGEGQISVLTAKDANASITQLDQALQRVNEERANIGAFQNRLESTIKGVDLASENLQAAESRVRDTDMAKEMVDFVKSQILSQSTASMLAQANLKPQLVLRVLG